MCAPKTSNGMHGNTLQLPSLTKQITLNTLNTEIAHCSDPHSKIITQNNIQIAPNIVNLIIRHFKIHYSQESLIHMPSFQIAPIWELKRQSLAVNS